MLEILLVCTGNICRSPVAQVVLEARLRDIDVKFESAGTRARAGMPMTESAARLAISRGADPAVVARHVSKTLTEESLERAALVVGMERDHRRQLVEVMPALTRRAFTAREIPRLVEELSRKEDEGGPLPSSNREASPHRLLADTLDRIAAHRGLTASAPGPAEDDVVDPYRRSWNTYMRCGRQLDPALTAIELIVRRAFA